MTVTNVKVTDDLKIAKVYISFLENKKTVDALLHCLIRKKNIISHLVAIEWKLKYIPELRFYYDDTMHHVEKVEKLINKIRHDD